MVILKVYMISKPKVSRFIPKRNNFYAEDIHITYTKIFYSR